MYCNHDNCILSKEREIELTKKIKRERANKAKEIKHKTWDIDTHTQTGKAQWKKKKEKDDNQG